MTRYEITILGGEGDLMRLVDRCVIEARTVREAARAYATLIITDERADDDEGLLLAQDIWGQLTDAAQARNPVLRARLAALQAGGRRHGAVQ